MQAQEAPPKPPVAKRVPKTTQIHGHTTVDDYFWLREKENPEVIEYLKQETAYTDAMTQSSKGFRDALYKEMLARIKETDVEVPYKKGNFVYYTRTIKGQQYPIYCRKPGSVRGKEEITLDENKLAKGKDFFSVGAYEISEDGNLLAYTTDETGFRQYTLHVKDLRTGRVTRNLAERVVSVEWANDNKTLFYTQEDATTKRSHKFFRQAYKSKDAALLYEEKDELYRIYVGKTRSAGYIVLSIASSTTSEIRYLSADHPQEELKLMLARSGEHEYYLDHIGEQFYIRTNDQGKNFRLVSVPVSDPAKENWKEIIPHRADVMLEDVDCFATHFVAVERQQGIPQLRITDLKSGKFHYIKFPEPVYQAYPAQNAEFKATKYRLGYESLITPRSLYDYDVNTKERKLLKQQPVLGGYNAAEYKSERLWATASDGTKVPISIVYKKGMRRTGKAPLLLEGYGSYGISNDVDFSSNRLSLLKRGVIYAQAHIRGGGEMGKQWHDDGKLMKKLNTFTDFIACAEHLVNEKYTASDRLAITGGSAGGLLMGAVTNMRPDLFKVVLSYVPFVDVMNTMLDASLPLTVGEYLEWGNPNEKAAYDYMRGYSPYENLAAKNYPTMLVRTSLNDSQVMYWEPAKYVARLRTLKTDNNLLLFKIKLEPGGHGGASGRYDRLKDTAFDYAFLLGQFGIVK
ncbi:MAG: S9 family peptidase [Acidobacteria bacterium]|nr:S9 family peptidase [Acidobacteriota bacterium]